MSLLGGVEFNLAVDFAGPNGETGIQCGAGAVQPILDTGSGVTTLAILGWLDTPPGPGDAFAFVAADIDPNLSTTSGDFIDSSGVVTS